MALTGNSHENLDSYRAGEAEQKRIQSLLGLIPEKGESALDIGARDGYIARLLTRYFESVTALDLEKPRVADQRITCVQGNALSLQFPDDCFDVVLCAEVLEHIPASDLSQACSEIARVSRRGAIIGVPYRQDIRVGRSTCAHCGTANPPWGHANVFDESRLRKLFHGMQWSRGEYVGENKDKTNPLSVFLLDYAGNPFGTYGQSENCAYCNKHIGKPSPRTILQKLATRVGCLINKTQSLFVTPHPNWINVYFSKR